MLGHHLHASETPCGVSLAGRWWPAYCGIWILSSPLINLKLEDLKVLRRSPDLRNNIKIGQVQLIMKQILFYHILGLQAFWSSDLNKSNEYSIKQPSDFWGKDV